jgi:hypothetical protein
MGLFAHQRVYEHLLGICMEIIDDDEEAKLQVLNNVLFIGINLGSFDARNVDELKLLLDFITRGYNKVTRSLSGDHRAFAYALESRYICSSTIYWYSNTTRSNI